MGVPAFFRKLNKRHKIVRSNPDKPIRALYIDTNCLLHPQCFTVLDMNRDLTNQRLLFRKMFQRVVAYIDYLIRLTNPTELVYIAIDGVAPLAKINQQRMRRFGFANNYRSEVYKKHGIKTNDSWSNIVITPGTQFMFELHKMLGAYYTNKVKNNTDPKCTYKVIYDSYLSPGEGEHKILQHLKMNTSPDEENATVIYGLDADLIFLSMASQIPNIYLLRESSQFNRSDEDGDDNSIEQELCYADIDFAKKSINVEFSEYYRKFVTNNGEDYSKTGMFDDGSDDDQEQELKMDSIKDIDFTNDYIFICYFLGNDFLPHLPSIDINMDGMEVLFNAYIDVFQTLGRNLISINPKTGKVTIDNEFLIEFIKIVATKEEDFFRRTLPDYLKKARHKRCFESETHKREVWRIENLKDVKVDDVIQLGVGEAHEWKYRYYSHYFKTHEHQKELVDKVCHNYVEGLVWVARYYFESCPSWRWQYKFTHAPFLSDLIDYIRHRDVMKDFNVEVHGPIDMYTQLVSVVPAVYSDILPQSLRHLSSSAESPIIDMFPLKYDVDMINKTQLYKCIPMIPYLDVNRVDRCVKDAKLTKPEKQRCVTTAPADLGTCGKVARALIKSTSSSKASVSTSKPSTQLKVVKSSKSIKKEKDSDDTEDTSTGDMDNTK
ncbi:XRN 5'-3' exonuclease [Yasminevirus sp. GU-2018]|uniref:XRN 5'-3' exonuclease n=1 Tax=Yasminevirus sp. GU-2018 TaxID=2420051 RepID=A0A5K0U885_9VIRU|nr:XRN 5'-3' exonuclease [Yasminevirus sp. GU-2018]